MEKMKKKLEERELASLDGPNLGMASQGSGVNDLHGDDGDSQTGGLQAASSVEAGQVGETAPIALDISARLAPAKGRVNDASAAAGAVTIGPGDVDEGADEGDIQHQGDEGEERKPGEAAQQQQAHQRVQNGSAGDALDGTDLPRDVQVVVVQRGEEVREDAEDDGGAEELYQPTKPLQEFEAEAGSGAGAHDGSDD